MAAGLSPENEQILKTFVKQAKAVRELALVDGRIWPLTVRFAGSTEEVESIDASRVYHIAGLARQFLLEKDDIYYARVCGILGTWMQALGDAVEADNVSEVQAVIDCSGHETLSGLT